MREIVQEIRDELTKLKSVTADQARTMPQRFIATPSPSTSLAMDTFGLSPNKPYYHRARP